VRRGQFAAAMSGWTDHDRETFADLLARFIAALDEPDGGLSAVRAGRQRDTGEDPGNAGQSPANSS
jgi:hypothetical protein